MATIVCSVSFDNHGINLCPQIEPFQIFGSKSMFQNSSVHSEILYLHFYSEKEYMGTMKIFILSYL